MENSKVTPTAWLPSWHIILLVLVTIGLVLVAQVLTNLHRDRQRYAHFPQLPISSVWGHLKVLDEFRRKRELDRHPDYMFTDMAEALNHPPFIFLDLRPVDFKIAVITNHEVAEQISKATKLHPWSLPKPPGITAVRHMTGDNSLLTREGLEWKALRKRFNPGFAPQHLNTLLPRIVDKVSEFVEILDDKARDGGQEPFALAELTSNLAFDVIGSVVLDLDMQAQNQDTHAEPHELFLLYNKLLETYAVDKGRYLPWWLIPLTKLKREYLARKVDKILKRLVKQRFHIQLNEQKKQTTSRRDILSLSLGDDDQIKSGVLTPTILQDTADQLKTFLFAGWDTTGVMLSWAIYELSRSPRALAAVRAELDDLFGPETADNPHLVLRKLRSTTSSAGAGGEVLINKMPYITAVLKETLRLYPPASTGRWAGPGTGFTVTAPGPGPESKTNREYCLDGLLIYICARAVHRDPGVYGEQDVNEFVPERWLSSAAASAEKKIPPPPPLPPSAWRPFERGPRNCIGQELAMLEGRVVLAAVARGFDFVKVGLGEVQVDESSGLPVWEDKGGGVGVRWKVRSELYNTRKITAKPVDGMKMKVTIT